MWEYIGHIVTDNSPGWLADLSESDIHQRRLRAKVERIRPKSLKRVVALDYIIRHEVSTKGDVYQEWLDSKESHVSPGRGNFSMSLTSSDYHRLMETTARELLADKEIGWLCDVSDRTARDAIATVQHFNNPLG